MTVSFPTDKTQPFQADNGVIYAWDENRWRVKAFRSVDDFLVIIDDNPPDPAKIGDLWYDSKPDELTLYIYTGAEWVPAAPPVSLDGINATIDAALIVQNDLLARVQAGETEQRKIQISIEELSITKGSVARYQVKDVTIGVASRNGELYVNNAKAEDVTAISFAPFDLNGQPTKPTHVGDIVEFIETTRSIGEVTRYRITSGTEPQALTVTYLSGNNNFEVDEPEEVYIYPQNEEGVSKDYVDAQDALLGIMINENGKEINKKLGKTDANVVNNNFRIKSDSKTYISTSGAQLALNHVKEPTAGHNAATKDYVDNNSGGIGIAAPAPLRWIWRNYDSTIDPGEGKFAWNSGSGFFRINYITADGINLGKSRPSTVDINLDTKLTGSIWYKDGDGWKLKQMFDVYRMQWDRNDCIWLYRSSIIVGADEFTADVQYHITVGGFF